MQSYSWFEQAYNNVITAYRSGSLPHALILSGAEGMGKSEFSLYLAQGLSCMENSTGSAGEAAPPCQVCRNCRLFEACTHPDVLVCAPEEGSQFIKVDQVRAIGDFVGQSAQINALKIVVLDPASALNINAANALLKNLEEPSDNTLYLLLDDQQGPLLPTIRSRCQILKLPTPQNAEALAWLRDNCTAAVDDVDAQAALNLAHGSPLRAKNIIENNGLQQENALIQAVGETIKGETSAVEFAEQFSTVFDLGIDQFIECQVIWLDAMIKSVMGQQFEALESRTGGRMFHYLATRNTMENLYEFRDELLLRRQDCLHGANLNQTLLLESMVNGWVRLMDHARTIKS